ncbi:MAG: hypothetical protein NT012_03335 [Candidatus Nealsonbacteria bacterium]|nr:hypothetical protein [Candidatus Nealsonbacteria bacterium]
MPQIFEFHFNPPKQNRLAAGKDDLIFDSFCFEPKNIYEKRMGDLYIVGLLKNVLPKNIRFLDVLVQKIKEKYYKAVSVSPEKSLKDTLRIANEHLEKIAKQGDVSWLGNLSFAVISLKDFELNFTKIGDLKLFLIRKGQLIDIDKKLKLEDIEPYPLKIFGNIVSGKLAENDIILVLSKEAYDAFLKENLLNEFARKSVSDLSPREIKKFKDVLNGKKEQLTKISGICLLIVLSKETVPKEKETLTERKSLKIFSLVKEVSVLFSPFASIGNSVKEVFNSLVKLIKKIQIPKPKIPVPKISFPKINLPKISLPKISFPKIRPRISYKFSAGLKKKIIPVLVLVLLLAMGFFLFEKKEEKKIKTYQDQISQIQEKINQAESYLILAEYNPPAKKNANILYKEVWDEISPLFNISSSLPPIIASQVLNLKNTVSKNLYQLNKLVEISEPKPIFEFKAKEFIPQRLISFKGEIYFFTPYSENIFKLSSDLTLATARVIEINKKFSLATPLSDSVIFFSKPNQIIILKENQFSETIYLEELSSAFDFTSFASYRSHLYFLDAKNGQIVRYPFVSELIWGTPESWLSPEPSTALDFKSMAVDGSIWILTEENAIERYHAGKLQETIDLDIFPYPKTFSKIFTSSQHPYLYLLEPAQKRIVIIDKSGQIIGQYQSEKFDNLLDFSVSEDGKTIWLLNGLTLYQINI